MLIFVDDGSAATHMDLRPCPLPCKTGIDIVTRLSGPLAFTFDNYKIEPIASPEIIAAASRPCPRWSRPGQTSSASPPLTSRTSLIPRSPTPAIRRCPATREYKHKL